MGEYHRLMIIREVALSQPKLRQGVKTLNDRLLELKEISKLYGENKVLDKVSFSVNKGEILCLLGENGAGKSTLMNILFGMPVIHSTGGFSGEIVLSGDPVTINSPEKAMELGIGMVHQEFMLIPGYTVAENIKLNREVVKQNPVSKFFGNDYTTLDYKKMNEDARKALDKLEIGIDEYAKVEGLPVGYMQFIEIAREIDKENIKLLVFDEPTAVLTEGEAENLIRAMRQLANQGIAIIFITHRLDEVMACSEHVVILRDGGLVAHKPTQETNTIELAELMVGRKIEKLVALEEGRQFSDDAPILELKQFKVGMPGEMVKGIDLKIRRGEIFGIGGLAGQGKIGISNGLMGLFPARGDVLLNGEPLELNNPMASLKRRMAFVSEDRKGVGLLLDEGIDLNIAISSMQVNNRFLKSFVFFNQIDDKNVTSHANEMVKLFDIRCTGTTQKTRRLSGGNQQKVCLARAITLEPELLLVSEPTRGIDIGAKKLVLDTLIRLNREQDMTIIMTSSELGELRSICDRIAIISEGKLVGILSPEDADAKYGLYMSGKTDLPEGVM